MKRKKVYSLSYADDVVLMAEEEDELRSMLEKLEGYLDKKGLVINIGKTKVMRCRRGGGR